MNNNKILSFFWQVIKPYKWWYLLMIQAPIISSFYQIANMYAVKLIIDAFTESKIVTYSNVIFPIFLYLGTLILQLVIWRANQFAWAKSQPFVRGDMTAKIYDYIQHHSYRFFQNASNGMLVSKIKGIVDGYDNIWHAIIHKSSFLLMAITSLITLLIMNVKLFILMLGWIVIFVPIIFTMTKKLQKLSNEKTESKHKVIGKISDNLLNIFSLFSFAKRNVEYVRIKKILNEDMAQKDYLHNKYLFKIQLVGHLFHIGMLFSIFILLIYLRNAGEITVGDFVFIMTISFTLVDYLWDIMEQLGLLMSQIGDFKSSFSIMQIPHDEIDKTDAKNLII